MASCCFIDRKLLIALLPIFFANLFLATATTDPLDLSSLQVLYGCLGSPPELTGWSSAGGGDPCGEEPWRGVACSGQSVVSIKIGGLGISGFLCSHLSDLLSLRELDVSYNNIGGEIPYRLPPNATHINLAVNNFSYSIPHSLPSLKALNHLNVSHNSLSGPIGNVFTDMQSLEQLDLSFNHFIGDLPSSFGSLTRLHVLHLQHNEFTGSVIFLADLPLSVLYLEDNHFSGYVPEQFEFIPRLRIYGNLFQPGFTYPQSVATASTSSPVLPADKIVSHSPQFSQLQARDNKKRKLLLEVVAGTIFGVFLVALFASAMIVIRIYKSQNSLLARPKSPDENFLALQITAPTVDLNQCTWPSPKMACVNLPSARHINPERIYRRKSCSRKSKNLINPKLFSASELHVATKGYSEENILGEGSIGCVYKAEFLDGQVLAVKKINMVALAVYEEDEFLDAIWNMSRLRHPNISTLIGYCVEEGEHILVYDYAQNGSLDDVLSSSEDTRKALSWKARVRIALGVAHAIEYMHWVCSPPITHGNIKASNILLDDELTPYLSDCGLTMLRHLINTMPKVSDATSFNGYAAPEVDVPEADKTTIDVYNFGVVLLQLLTGRRPFDSSMTDKEQDLAQWASFHLHDLSSLEERVDPAIKGTIPFKALSRFADIILLCIQREPNFRSPMTDITESMLALVKTMNQHHSGKKKVHAAEASEHMSELSFRTTVDYFDPPSSPVTI